MRPFYSSDAFDPQRSIGYLIKRLSKLATSQIEARFEGRELTMTHWIALAMIQHGIVDNCASLARQLGHNSGATTRLVDQLEARGLIVRTRGGCDRRVNSLACTPTGIEQFEALTPLLLDVWNNALDGYDAAKVETFINMLTSLVATFERQEVAVREAVEA